MIDELGPRGRVDLSLGRNYKVGDKQGCEVLAWTPASFYALCYHHANPEAIYIKGARLFFFYDSPEE
ncbi:hypothetical protein YC2023_060297 [Brassica napus]